MNNHYWKFVLVLVVLIAAGGIFTSLSHNPEEKHMDMADMPDYVQQAPERVQEAYLFAVSHPEHLEHQPCYCGCNAMGHMNNLECYVKDYDATGAPLFDNHASYCGVCVDITLDVKRLDAEGWTPLEIRRFVDATYSEVGPSTDTPLPQS